MTIYGTCRTNQNEVHAENAVSFYACADSHGASCSGYSGYKEELQDGFLVDIGRVTSDCEVNNGWTGERNYKAYKIHYCDGSEPILVSEPSTPC